MSRLGGFSIEEVERYSRQLVMPQIGPEGQRGLKSSSVIVVGAGGLGIPASIYLVAAGVGKLGLADYDVIERSNLHRQTLYSEADVGKPKAEVASERLRMVNPHVSITAYNVRIDSSNAMGILSDYDVVVDCSDNFPTRYLLSDASVFLHKPDVYAGVSGFEGQASVFQGDRGPCYRCLHPAPPPPGSVKDCDEAGVLGVVPGIMGSIQAAQAISIITGGESLVGRLLLFSAGDMSFNELRIKKNPACPVCGEKPTIETLLDYEEFCGSGKDAGTQREIGPRELKSLMDVGENFELLDVREPYEYDMCRLNGSKLIPLGELERRASELDRSDRIVVYCHVGSRSAVAVDLLSSLGFEKAKSLTGGLRAWAEQVDPGFPRY